MWAMGSAGECGGARGGPPRSCTALFGWLTLVGCVDLARPPELFEAGMQPETGGVDGGAAADQPERDSARAGDDKAARDGEASETGPAAFGAPCARPTECQSGFCVQGVCCRTACTETCHTCNAPSSAGACVPVAAGQDPLNQCLAQPASTCGRAGGCDGKGGCLVHAAGVECAEQSCVDSSEILARVCDGRGACGGGSRRDCGGYSCQGSACGNSCSSSSRCRGSFACVGGACVGPALYWKFDESSGNSALDASGNGLHGTYRGVLSLPGPSSNVPILQFANPASRAFIGAYHHEARVDSLPALLRPANEVTLSAWFRTRTVDQGGVSLIATGGDGYFIAFTSAQVVLGRGTAPAGTEIYCPAAISNHLDGNWHHVAGVLSSTGMRLYFDGVERCSNGRGESLVYSLSIGLLVGRYTAGDPSTFDGNIDELRIYTRALSAEQVAGLAAGGP
jgi:hypothetical protein